ncbi:protein sel-1 homolog 3 [Eucyclogobius newberryi]|uniref:protein sel-1 homolog 3 n=1 Tax=Eucyclogobius newberryi TaxID=166745 RepID=UPI003B592DF8
MEAASLSISLCQLVLCVQMLSAENTVTLLNPPEEAVPDHYLKVQFSCDSPASVHLHCSVSFESGSVYNSELRSWRCVPGDLRTRSLSLDLPDWLVYRPDGTVRLSQWVLSCLLQVSLTLTGDDSVVVQVEASLEPKPYFSRPLKQHKLCFSWSAEMLKFAHVFDKMVCPIEQETVTLLSSIFASTGEHFGITKTLQPFNNELLEHLRLKAIPLVSCAFSFWLFVTKSCQHRLCGMIHHIDRRERYITPTIFLTPSSQLHIQMSGEALKSSAFLSPFSVPLREWCHFTLELHGTMVDVSMVCLEKDQRKVYSAKHAFDFNLVMDDTDGYFVIGGGKFVRTVEGFFGSVLFYRNRIPEHAQTAVELPHMIQTLNLSRWLNSCEDFEQHMSLKIREALLTLQRTRTESCVDAYQQYMTSHRRAGGPQCEDWEAVPASRKYAAKVAKFLVSKRGGRVNVRTVGRALFRLSLQKLGTSLSPAAVKTQLLRLQQAGCLQEPSALHLSAVLYSTGLGVQQSSDKSWLLSLLSAQMDHRLALLRLGFLHLHGLSGVPSDPDLAYAYYSNIAQQTTIDRLKTSAQQTMVEVVHLNDQNVLEQQTSEDHHIFQWLKFLAQKGEAQAEERMGQMLFWGQRGVASDLHKAVSHYQRGAELHENPVSMYDYGIVLLQGQGVEKDIPKAVFYLKKAMDKGSIPAMNALAWYYEQYEKNYQAAVELWERADLQGSPDAAMNLGVMYLQGNYPNKPPSQFLAHKYFLKSADRGEIKAANQVAEFWTTGIYVDRRPLEAVRLSKWAAEHNGFLGSVLRRGLHSYLQNDMRSSLLFYLMAAESGFAAAQFNVAYICEQNAGQFLHPDFVASCMWKYYNLNIQSKKPHTYALLKLGDMLYQGHGGRQRDLDSAAHMYTEAALRKQPQGLYNLGRLVEEGYELHLFVLRDLGLSALYQSDQAVILKALYQKCRDSNDTDSFLPCTLTLFSVYLRELQENYSVSIKYWSVLVATLVPTLYLLFSRFVLRDRTPSTGLRPGPQLGPGHGDV